MTHYEPSEPVTIGALFDLSFTRFITPSVIKVIYLLGMLMLALLWIVGIVISLTQGFVAFLGMLVVGTILLFIYLLMMRVWLELIAVIFRIGDNAKAIASSLGATPPTGGFPITTPTNNPPGNPI
jgi:hypothetical protein